MLHSKQTQQYLTNTKNPQTLYLVDLSKKSRTNRL